LLEPAHVFFAAPRAQQRANRAGHVPGPLALERLQHRVVQRGEMRLGAGQCLGDTASQVGELHEPAADRAIRVGGLPFLGRRTERARDEERAQRRQSIDVRKQA
jgi:hypothetical protein